MNTSALVNSHFPSVLNAANSKFKSFSLHVPLEIHSLSTTRSWSKTGQAGVPVHDYFEVVWIIKGTGRFIIDAKNYEIAQNQAFYMNPGQIHHFEADENAQGYVIRCQREYLYSCVDLANTKFMLNESFLGNMQSCVINLNAEIQTEMFEIVQYMQNELKCTSLLQPDVLQGFLKIFLIYLTRQKNVSIPASKVRYSDLTRRFLALVENQFVTMHKVSDYADLIAITPNYLNVIVKKDSGFPASHHIFQRIVLEAKRMYLFDNRSMKQVAYALGFDDVAHFSKFFKNVSGGNFTEFTRTSAI